MELRSAEGGCRRAPKRKTLGDVTNLVTASTSGAAASAKRRSRTGAKAEPALRRVPDVISNRSETSSIGSCNSGDTESRKGVPSTSAAPVEEAPAGSVDAHRDNFEPSTVNTLRSTKRKKNKWQADLDVIQSSCPPIERIRSSRDGLTMESESVRCHGTCSVPYLKPPQKKWHYSMAEAVTKHQLGLPQEFIEKQKAYYAEIDAFELPEEVVSESELE